MTSFFTFGPPFQTVRDVETLEDVIELSVVLVQVVSDVVAVFPDENDAVVGECVAGFVELAEGSVRQVGRLHVFSEFGQERREHPRGKGKERKGNDKFSHFNYLTN